MKKGLIMVMSCTQSPYDKLAKTSQKTWDSIDVKGLETIFYFGESEKENTEKEIYFPVHDHLFGIGIKNIMAFNWALRNKDWDYMIRPNASTYVHKERLLNYIQTLPDNNVYSGLQVISDTEPTWVWGPFLIMSRDVVKQIMDNGYLWNHSLIEDKAMSYIANQLDIPFSSIEGCSIDKTSSGWQCTSYANNSYTFTNFEEVKNDKKHFLFRCKQDYNRDMDHYVMTQLFKNL